MVDPVVRRYDQIDCLGQRGWRDRNSEGRVRNILLGLRVRGMLDRKALLREMAARGHDVDSLRRLDRLVDKTYLETGPNAEGSD